MSTIITRSTGSNPKGAPLTAGELDSNFINLNADKVESTRAINTTAGDLTGGGDLSGDRTLGLASTGISAGTVQNSATQVTPLTLDIKGRVTAVGTPVTIAPDFSNVANKPTTLSGYGITDAQATITGAATTIDTEDLTASKVLVSNASGKVAASDISTTTLGYLDATSSVQGQLDAKQATTAKNAANGYAGLDANAKLPTSLLPALAISEYLGSAADQTARLALTGEKGDWCSQADNGKVYVITGDDPTDNASWTALTYPVTPGITLNGTSIDPGDTATITAATTNTLTIGTGLSGTSFNGSAATTIAIDSSVVTLTGTQTLTNKTLTSPVISGGTVNNTAIGGTTPAAGAFTTLSASSTVSGSGFSTYLASPPAIGGSSPAAGNFTNLGYTGTLTGGTGVIAIGTNQIYKDSSGNVGIGTSSPAFPLEVRTASGGRVRFGDGTNNLDFFPTTGQISTGGNVLLKAFSETGIVSFSTGIGAPERLRIDSSGNVGIGTNSPESRLSVLQSALDGNAFVLPMASSAADGNYTSIRGKYAVGNEFCRSEVRFGVESFATGKGFLAFATGTNTATERLRIDSSGNFGLGVTPSAWSGLAKAIQLSGGSIFQFGGDRLFLRQNSFVNSSNADVYTANGLATSYRQYNGQHDWWIAPNNTSGAGATAVFTQAMTLDASGGLLVGVTSNPGTGALVLSRDGGSTNWLVGPSTGAPNQFYVTATLGSQGVYLTSTTATSWTGLSDERYKDILEPITDAVSKVRCLRTVIGKFKNDETNTRRAFLIAQDVQAALPEAVDASNPEKLGVAYTDIIPLLAAAIKELTARLETLEAKVN